jgi:hypothetical protein
MKALVISAACLAGVIGSASAETRYDRKLERAIMDNVAKKFRADMRGTLTFNSDPVFVVVQDSMSTGSLTVPVETVELGRIPPMPRGLMPAAERKVSRVISF